MNSIHRLAIPRPIAPVEPVGSAAPRAAATELTAPAADRVTLRAAASATVEARALPSPAGSVGQAQARPRLASVPRTLLAEETPRLLAVPDTRQSTTYSCGAAALQSVLMYWGLEYRELELMERLHTDPENGTNPRDIVRVAQEDGLQAELRDNQTLDDLKASVDAGCPVIIACQAWREGDDLNKPWADIWDSGHYMVVVGMDGGNVYFEDPSMLGSRGVIARAEFEERWHDVDDRPYVRSAIYIEGDRPQPPPAFMHVD